MRQEFQPIGRLEEDETVASAPAALRNLRQQAARERANAHLSRFAPLLYALQSEDPQECRTAISSLQQLRKEEAATVAELEQYAEPEDAELTTTLRSATAQSELIEAQLRQRLSRIEPGAPEGMVNLAALRETLAEVAAKKELAEATGTNFAEEDKLEFNLSHPNWGAAAGMGIFGLGWTAFTLFHATVMIGGMMRAIGPGALFLLLFYGIFFTVGFGMLAGAVQALSEESIEAEGNTLTVRRKLGSWIREKQYRLGPDSRVAVGMAQMRSRRHVATEIILTDIDGKEFRIGRYCPEPMKHEYVTRINNYLKRQFRRRV